MRASCSSMIFFNASFSFSRDTEFCLASGFDYTKGVEHHLTETHKVWMEPEKIADFLPQDYKLLNQSYSHERSAVSQSSEQLQTSIMW